MKARPKTVLDAIAHILLAKLYRKPIDRARNTRYRRYISSHELAAKSRLMRQLRGRKHIHSARGHHYHLEEIFDDLNRRFFHGLMGRPQLTWSRDHARNRLGHYDPAHNTIVISKVFDHKRVPRYVVEYIVYHEMLHLKHPVKLQRKQKMCAPERVCCGRKFIPGSRTSEEILEDNLRALRLLLFARRCNPQEHQHCSVQPHHIFIRKSSDTRTNPHLRHRRDFIDHKPAIGAQPVAFTRLDPQSKERSIGRVGGKCTYRDRICPVEAVVLQNHNWTRLSGVVPAASHGPNLAALHTALLSEIASMKPWSALA